jgi:hypothetical protein
MKSEVSYNEFGAGDASKARAFLGQLFGWDFRLVGKGPEGLFQTPSIKAGLHGNDPAPGIFVFFSVPDLEEAIAKVMELGGEASEPSEEPGLGPSPTCRDPQGIPFGLHQLGMPQPPHPPQTPAACRERFEKPTILSLSAQRLGSRPRVLSFSRLRGDCQLTSFPIVRIGAVTSQVWFVSLPCSQSPTKNQSICWMFKAKYSVRAISDP